MEALRSSARVSSQDLLNQMDNNSYLPCALQCDSFLKYHTSFFTLSFKIFFFLQEHPLKVSIQACNSSNFSDDVLHGGSSQLHPLDKHTLRMRAPLLCCSLYLPSHSMIPRSGS